MGTRTLLSYLDHRRIRVTLRADGWTYDEMAVLLGIDKRLVRHELEQAPCQLTGLLDHRGSRASGRLAQLIYVIGFTDDGGDPDELPDQLGSLVERAKWLRSRMRAGAPSTDEDMPPRAMTSATTAGSPPSWASKSLLNRPPSIGVQPSIRVRT